jgi:5'-methylthioadenosine phosphorylase
VTEAVGVIGGSGFYEFLAGVEEHTVDTPYGPPSAPVAVGEVEGVPVAFLPRHGREHELPPHRVPYRANVWALRELGVRRIVGPCASGSLRADLGPGTFVVCDQFVDRTSGRDHTFYDGPEVVHVAAADPYCADLRATVVEVARELDLPVVDGGTVVVVEGPRFSTRAESTWFAAAGWDVVNMTAYPEGWLARELGLCYANVSLVTDYDVGVAGDPSVPAVTAAEVMEVFARTNARLRELLRAAVPRLGPQPEDACRRALDGARV